MNATQFYSVIVGGLCFEGHLSSDGPYLYGIRQHSGTPIGQNTSLRKFRPADVSPRDPDGESWWAVRHDDQCRINLNCLSDAEIRRLGRSFGIPLWPRDDDGALFFQSPAFAGLAAWARKHPVLAERYNRECGSCVGSWLDHVLPRSKHTPRNS